MDDKDFIGKEFLQRCGDILVPLEKIIKKNSKGWKETFYYCKFINYPYETLRRKHEIEKGIVPNPIIDDYNFIGHIFPQNCGDSIKVLRKTDEKDNYKHPLYEGEFINKKCIVKRTKSDIKKGEVLNPLIEEDFVNKLHPQNCGDIIKIIEKTSIKGSNGKYFYRCQFQKYPCEVLFQKWDIINGNVDNPNLPWKSKEGLVNILNKISKKITIQELAYKLNLSYSFCCNLINKYNLKDYICYYENVEEKFLYEYLKFNIKLDIIRNNWIKDKNGKDIEIDIYFPKKKLGIEYNGSYWHSELYKDKNYHQEKSLKINEQNIQLIHIFDFEWREKQNICEALIKSKLGIFDKKIGARKCQIKELDNKTYQDFCNQNHLQGEAGAKIKLGLFYQNELVQVMSFGCPRFTDKYEWEIIRECSKLGYFILGGKEKLWSYFVKTYNPNNCISYCDFSKFTGESYLKLGFKFLQLNKPGFWWYDKENKKIYWRNPYKNQEMKDKGYLKIYDCGQLVFSWLKF